jgi:hypothetical protein
MSTWDPGAVATFYAALVGGIVALASLIATIVDGVASRRKLNELTKREQWWTRWSWTVEKSLSESPAEREMGLVIMDALVDMPWLSEDDEQIALAVSKAVIARNTAENGSLEEPNVTDPGRERSWRRTPTWLSNTLARFRRR